MGEVLTPRSGGVGVWGAELAPDARFSPQGRGAWVFGALNSRQTRGSHPKVGGGGGWRGGGREGEAGGEERPVWGGPVGKWVVCIIGSRRLSGAWPGPIPPAEHGWLDRSPRT